MPTSLKICGMPSKLKLNDAALHYEPETSAPWGLASAVVLRLLHMEIVGTPGASTTWI